ncbi:hypothetical protein M2132_001742 [Dysgonomonas sp. PH5-45]|uniref:hypothetical protein n=1 Tax=unclassified Dysgonomonas TaxID=2630389 RepID=UPI002476C17F|nr:MULTISPECIES: hypothetical protein [unclassified Dysgonomonas]MDH6355400.1 hypothetical protein [Dysgonomonas sp. PH5-45]MDH6388297.1 hypothetical protein [Dysgonomonas sp. PH5-37]
MKDIGEIIDRYFEGETSLKEEKLLRQYFKQGDIDERYRIYAPIFCFFSEEKAEKGIDSVSDSGSTNVSRAKKKKRLPIYLYIGIASSFLLFFIGRAVYLNNDTETSKSIVYIDGKKISDKEIVRTQAIVSINNVSDLDADAIDSQISVLESFIQ